MRSKWNSKITIIAAVFGAVLFVWLIISIASYKAYKEDFYGISLKNVHCSIPKRMWKPDEDDMYMSEHMFRITDKELNYIIYASQLEMYDKDDEKYGLFKELDDRLLNYDSSGQILSGIQSGSDLLKGTVKVSKETKNVDNPPYLYCRFLGEAGGKYEGYKAYVTTSKNREFDVRYFFVLLYRAPEALSEEEINEMWRNGIHGNGFCL